MAVGALTACWASAAGDGAGLDHLGDHQPGARRGAFGVVDRVEGRRRVEDGSEDRRLGDGDVAGGLAEELLRCLLHPDGAGAEIGPVEIELEDLVLGEPVLQPQGEDGFLELALVGAVGLEEQVLGQLLGDGRAALDDAAGLLVGDEGAHQADGIDAEVMLEAAVLDGDDGFGHVARQLADAHLVAEERAAFGHHMAVGRQQHHAGLALGQLEEAAFVEIVVDVGRGADADDAGPDAQRGAPGDDAQDREAAAPGRPPGLVAARAALARSGRSG
jgi:hypothetical protein